MNFACVKNRCVEILKNNKSLFLRTIVIAFAFGIITHGFMYFSNSVAYDALNEFVTDKSVQIWKVQLGRVFVPIYQNFTRGLITLPFLVGILATLYTAISLFFVCKIFDINSNLLIILIAGIFTANITTISLTSTFIHDLDSDMLSLMFSVIAVYLWKRYKFGYLYAIIPLIFTMGLYQAFVQVTITLIIIYSILTLLKGGENAFKDTLIKGLKGVVTLCATALIYFISAKIIAKVYGTSIMSNGYNSIDKVFFLSPSRLFWVTVLTYFGTIKSVIMPLSAFSNPFVLIVHITILLSTIALIIANGIKNRLKVKEWLGLALLIGVLPFGLNICQILANGMSHDVMHFSFCLVYLLAMLVARESYFNFKKEKINLTLSALKPIIFVLVGVTIFGNVRLANTAYTIRAFEKDANISLMTRIVDDIESSDIGYITGETKIVFVGEPTHLLQSPKEFKKAKSIHGMYNTFFPLLRSSTYQAFFDYYLMYPGLVATDDEKNKIIEDNDGFKDMEIYPSANSMKMQDGYLIVKLG